MNESNNETKSVILPRREEVWDEFGTERYGSRMYNRGLYAAKEMIEKQGFTVYFLDEVEAK